MRYVTDTHALVWHLSKDSRLSPASQEIFKMADAGDAVVFVSAITLIEMIFLGEKGKVAREICEHTLRLFESSQDKSYHLIPVDQGVSLSVASVPREIIPEMPDRIIAATASHLGLPLITKDQQIHGWKGIEAIW